jgi:aminoglycoside phosphotransferase (APT) family kinase protein
MTRILPPLHSNEFFITVDLIKQLLKSQAPSLATCRLRPVIPGGTDHVMVRIGDSLVGRFPRHPGAVSAAKVEREWLRHLNGKLLISIPKVVLLGEPDHMYPAPWSILSWLPGQAATPLRPNVSTETASRLARDLGLFVKQLRHLPIPDRLPVSALPQSYRTESLLDREAYMLSALDECDDDEFDRAAVLNAWNNDKAAFATHRGSPLAAHGDLQPSNIILDPETHKLAGVIDWAGLSFGDPAVDLLPAWMLLDRQSRTVFRASCGVDQDMWCRGRAWALSIGIVAYPYYKHSRPDHAAVSKRQVEEVLAETGT